MDSTYEDQNWNERKSVQSRMRDVPQIVAALADLESPRVSLKCAKGHVVVEVQLTEDHRGDLFVQQSESPLVSPRQQVARRADPLETGRTAPRSAVCAEPNCPSIVRDGADTCVKHGSLRYNRVDSTRVQFVCSECTSRSGNGKVRPITVTQARLLRLYTTAVVGGTFAAQIQ